MANKYKDKLPVLTVEDVENIAKYLLSCNYEPKINYDGICCGSDGVDMGVNLAANMLREAYGIKVVWFDRDEKEEDE